MTDLKDDMKARFDTAKNDVEHGAQAVREGAGTGFATAVSGIVRAVNTVSGVVTTLRALDRDDGLAWLGLARRRPLRSALTFSAGLAVGTGLGFLFAPMAGADMRSALWGRLTTKRTSEPVATVDAAPQPESASPNRAPVARDSGASKLPNTGLPS